MIYDVFIATPSKDHKETSAYDMLVFNAEVQQWCKENCEGNYSGYVSSWVFEFKQDAAFFKLVWGGK